MLRYEQLRDWVSGRYGPRHAERRITDAGFAYFVDTQPDAYHDGDPSALTYGNGPDIVVKRNGGVWHFGSAPAAMPLYEARTEEELRRALAGQFPGCDLDRPYESVPLSAVPVTQPSPYPPAPQSPYAPPVPGQSAPPVASPYPPAPQSPYAPPVPGQSAPPVASPYPPAPQSPYAPPVPGPYQVAPGQPAGAPYPAPVPVGAEFVAADADNGILVDASGVCFDQGGRNTEFAWHEIRAVHHTVRGLCLLVGVVHWSGVFHECRVSAKRQARLREWSAQLTQVLGVLRGGPGS